MKLRKIYFLVLGFRSKTKILSRYGREVIRIFHFDIAVISIAINHNLGELAVPLNFQSLCSADLQYYLSLLECLV